MSDEQFLVRWTRRKQEARADQAEPARDEAAEAHRPAPSDRAGAEQVPPETDLSNLPPIESINAATDVTAFLRRGIPQELRRAALRRAWSADPAVCHFVGLSENAWDFNDPNAMPGFGPLDYSAEQIDALVRRIVGGVVETAESFPNPLGAAAEDSVRSAHAEAGSAQPQNPMKAPEPLLHDESAAAELSSGSAASQPAAATAETPLLRRTHGGALPH